MTARKAWRCVYLLVNIFLAACQSQTASTSTVKVTVLPAASATPTAFPPTLTGTSSLVPFPSPTLFPLPASDTPIVACDERRPADDDLLAIVTASFGLAPDYVHGDQTAGGPAVDRPHLRALALPLHWCGPGNLTSRERLFPDRNPVPDAARVPCMPGP